MYAWQVTPGSRVTVSQCHAPGSPLSTLVTTSQSHNTQHTNYVNIGVLLLCFWYNWLYIECYIAIYCLLVSIQYYRQRQIIINHKISHEWSMVTLPNNMTWHMLSVFMAGAQLEKIVFLFRNFHSHVGWWLHGLATVHCKYLNWTMDMCVVLTFNFNGDLDFLTVSCKWQDKLGWHKSQGRYPSQVFDLNPLCHMQVWIYSIKM